MENIYKDPENIDEIIEKIKECPTLKEVELLIKELYPTWILYYLVGYSKDYPHLQSNWENIVSQHNIKKGRILIVDYYNKEDKNTQLLKIFCELYTMSGFIVRTKDELTFCKVCNLAIPCYETFKKMKDIKDLKIIDDWSDVCSSCKTK
jgi:hypothetical protein